MSLATKILERQQPEPIPRPSWSYKEAFSRNLGILTQADQDQLRNSHVAIAGMGGVGGVHLITLVRLGIGNFSIADPDYFEAANFNRQYGAKIASIGRSKVEVMAEEAKAINPDVKIRIFSESISPDNVADFLDGADVFVDGVDFFAHDARRLLFQEARQRGQWAITAGPHAFSAAWIIFDPKGMSFDSYFDIHDGMSNDQKLVAFAVGCVPSAIHLKYLNLDEFFRPGQKHGASLGLACQLASGIVGAEVTRIVLGRPGTKAAPWYFQFDAYRGLLRKSWLWGGNRHPWQRLKRWWLHKKMTGQSEALSRV